MPRFGTKSLLFAFALIALWLSTFSGYAAGHDVRASVLLIVFLTAGFAAIFRRGKRRVYWAGFFVTMLLCGNKWVAPKFVPNFNWPKLVSPPAPSIAVYSAPATAPVDSFSEDGQTILTPVQPYASPPVYVPGFAPAPAQSQGSRQFALALEATIEAGWILALASIVGFIGVWLYDATPNNHSDQATT